MGCGSSQGAVQDQEAAPNGHVKRASPPLKETKQEREVVKKESRKEKRKGSAKSKSSRSSSASSRSSASSKRSRPETAPGGNAPAQVEAAQVGTREPAEGEVAQNNNEENADQVKNNEQTDGGKVAEENEQTVASAQGGNTADGVVKESVTEDTSQQAVPPEASNTQEAAAEPEHEKPNFNEDVLKEFVEVENQIRSLEAKGAETAFQTKNARLFELHKDVLASKEKVEQLSAQTAKEYQDVVDVNAAASVRSLFVNQAQIAAEVAKEQQEYVDALNRQEVAEQEHRGLAAQYKKLYDEVIAARQELEEWRSLKSKEEQLLGKIFNDSYGSEKEWKLEMELDPLGERKQRIQAAHKRWTAARLYLDAAIKQLSWSTRRWAQIAAHHVTIVVVKYQMVAEVRNHLIAASQNINSAHQNIAPIKPPYCTKQDLDDLHGTTDNIFNDVNIPAKYQKSYNYFASMFSKCSHLNMWVERVIKDTISRDLENVNQQFQDKYFELKEERMTLIKDKVKEKLGVELEVDIKKDELPTEDVSPSEESDVAKPGEVSKEEGDEQAPEPEEQEGIPSEPPVSSEEPTSEGGPQPPAEDGGEGTESKPSALSELAPPPSEQDLFGDIEELKKQHEEELAEFEKAQEMNKARVEQGLQEKLRARRSRRRKIQQEEAEAAMPPPVQ